MPLIFAQVFFLPSGKGERTMNKLNILLVDDEVEFITSLAERLALRGFNTLTATDGPGALELIKKQSFQAVVLDVMMPGMDGLETLQEIKKIDESLEVILLTGHASVQVALQGIQAGAFDYLVKPVDVDELAFRLQDACEKRGLSMGQGANPIP
jgi:two-component system, OmpR family, response regulator